MGHIQKIQDTLKDQERNHEPWTSGVVNLKGSESLLFFTCKDGSSRQINVGSISEDDIHALIDACEPAPFGRGTESVLDDNYRRALKLEESSFAWRFNPDSGDFIAQLAQRLSPWDTFEKGFRAEVTKLNIYTQGDFFKTHQDTPRSEQMFGSLVFTFSTPHTGGDLILRHRDRSLNFDAPSLLASAPSPSVAYAAFYSDVEHEVLEVTSGIRITITFNLYFDSSRAPPVVPSQRIPVPENSFMASLRQAFRDAAFIREYKYLDFGLEYQYPRNATEGRVPKLKDLKGPDAFLFYALHDTGLHPLLRYLYGSNYNSWGKQFDLLLSGVVHGRDEEDTYYMAEMQYLLEDDDKALIVWKEGESEETLSGDGARCYKDSRYIKDYRSRSVNVKWITPPSANLSGETRWTESGNEPMQEIYYYKVCIIVDASHVPCPPPLAS